MPCVAPSAFASSSRPSTRSMAMMVAQPQTDAPRTAANPTAPAPRTATDEPGDAGPLVPEDRGERCPEQPVPAREVGVADPDAGDPDQHLVLDRLGQVDLLERERRVRRANDGGKAFHGWSPEPRARNQEAVCF